MKRDARFLRQQPKFSLRATNVNRCIELANDAKDAETRLILFELVKGWLEAAAKLEKIKPSAKDVEIVSPRRAAR